jgi:circadian clock protein KaiB
LSNNGNGHDHTTESFEAALTKSSSERYVLTLYITGATPQSTQALRRIREVCSEHLEGRYDLEVIDIYQQPELARDAQIIAAPTLVKELPPPLRKLIGNLSDLQRVLVGLGLQPKV